MINAPFVFHAKRNQDEKAHLRTHDGGSGSALSGRCIDAFPTVRNIGCRRSNRVVLALVPIFCGTSTGAGAFPLIEFGIIIYVGLATTPLRILIADDSRTVRHSLHGLLEQHPGWEVCAEAVDGLDAVAKAQQCRPDVIVLDFFMPGMTGVEAAQVLGRILPSVPVLIVTLYITAELAKQAKAAGVKGAAPKSDTHS
jgi:CheY-like chemotaxis protein